MNQGFLFNIHRVTVNAYSIKVYVIQSKNRIMINVGVSAKK